eukprot:2344833-Pyramimonas_sp.AAC.1
MPALHTSDWSALRISSQVRGAGAARNPHAPARRPARAALPSHRRRRDAASAAMRHGGQVRVLLILMITCSTGARW